MTEFGNAAMPSQTDEVSQFLGVVMPVHGEMDKDRSSAPIQKSL